MGCGKVDVFSRQHIHGVLDAGAQVGWFKVGIVIAGDLVKPESLADQFQHAPNGDARTRYAGFFEMNLRVDGDSILHGEVIPDRARRRK